MKLTFQTRYLITLSIVESVHTNQGTDYSKAYRHCSLYTTMHVSDCTGSHSFTLSAIAKKKEKWDDLYYTESLINRNIIYALLILDI